MLKQLGFAAKLHDDSYIMAFCTWNTETHHSLMWVCTDWVPLIQNSKTWNILKSWICLRINMAFIFTFLPRKVKSNCLHNPNRLSLALTQECREWRHVFDNSGLREAHMRICTGGWRLMQGLGMVGREGRTEMFQGGMKVGGGQASGQTGTGSGAGPAWVTLDASQLPLPSTPVLHWAAWICASNIAGIDLSSPTFLQAICI